MRPRPRRRSAQRRPTLSRLRGSRRGSRHRRSPPISTEVLRALLDSYVDRLPDGLADLEREKFAGDRVADLSVLWAGGLETGEPHYYRIQGSDLLVEYDNTQRDVNHVHTVWRDLSNDFGGDALAAHYRDHQHDLAHQHGAPHSHD